MFTASGPQEMPVPRELSTEEVASTVDDFRRAAAAAITAGAPTASRSTEPTAPSDGTFVVTVAARRLLRSRPLSELA
ncbi:hypothetical protein GCM10022233_68320 [Streptomyces shaanxiensis]|uniref:Uncharacterized protein n=1 Tax=Streptomyces shaanxiensis TaxID=653357 RepID=A0ABP7W1H5_9ACTN